MTLLGDELATVAHALGSLEADFALVGGLAVSTRCEPRFTRDVDIAVAVDSDADAEHLVFEMRRFGYETLATLEHDATGRLATARLASAGAAASVVVDLLFASSGVESEVVAAADVIEILPGLRIRVATTGHLLALKLLSESDTRPNDTIDLRSLAAVANVADWTVAAAAVTEIAERGYDRGRDLTRRLAAIREELG